MPRYGPGIASHAATPRARLESFRLNLAFVPMLFVIGAVGVGFATVWLDIELGEQSVRFPLLLTSTVDSARAVLATIAGATITFAAIVFSVSLLMLQQTTTQFSSRVLAWFYRDSFTKRVMGTAAGTFAYCLVVLRSVRQPIDSGGTAVIPRVSVLVAVTLGILSVLMILAFINHVAHSMEAGEVIRRITEEARAQIVRLCPHAAGTAPPIPVEGSRPAGDSLDVVAEDDGWVQHVDADRLIAIAPRDGVVMLDAGVGTFVAKGQRVCTIRPRPEDGTAYSADEVRRAVHLGRTRTPAQDMALGFRQLVDIALRALSPGVHDPTTAVESVSHIGSLLRELLGRDLPPRIVAGEEGRRLFRPHDFDHADYVGLAFDQVRRASTSEPVVGTAILASIEDLVTDLEGGDLNERARLLRDEAQLVVDGLRRGGLRAADLRAVEVIAERLELEDTSA
ncbi:MAG TPA: DUF2254 domain-containing protein [Acidimicrobiia bacterium]|nr:DUF2254 domain-containing protein [Acidimicrobiia bacterium]